MKKSMILALLALIWSCGKGILLPKANIATVDSYIFDTLPIYNQISDKWWIEFGDKQLDSLVEKCLVRNSSIKETMLAIENAKLTALNIGSSRLPQFSINGAVTSSGGSKSDTKWGYSGLGEVAWQLDLFGKLRNSELSSYNSFLASEWGGRAVRLTLIESVITTYFALLTYKQSSEVSKESYLRRKEGEILIDSMYLYGAVSLVELEQSKSLTGIAMATMYEYQRLKESSTVQLATLLGGSYQEVKEIVGSSGNLFKIQPMPNLPVGVPSLLLERRPDVMEAFYNYHKALYSIKEARADRFPSISLSFSAGSNFTSLAPWVWSGGAAIVEPIFKWGIKKRSEQMAINSGESAALAYAQSYISAIGDVNSALSKIESGKKRCAAQRMVMEATQSYKELNQHLYMDGLSSYLEVLEGENALLEAQIGYISTTQTVLNGYVELFTSLGGGIGNNEQKNSVTPR